ncbi:MAG: FAD-dependent oxidoreductase, partial [Deltaproteobacteria bacterium]
GHLMRPGDHAEPQKIAFLQCVGSRDVHHCDHGYCSSVCCMYALKEASLAQEHSNQPLEVAIFYMDMRTFGKDFEKYYEKAQAKGIRFIRSRVHSVDPMEDGGLKIRYLTEAGQIISEEFDLLVLAHGLEISRETVEMAKRLGVEVDQYNFARTSSFAPVATSKPGIYACGVFTEPKDIPISVMEASAAASAASSKLAPARHTLVQEKVIPAERNVIGDPPRVGVFICHCGLNIGGIIRVPDVVAYAQTLPYVEYVDQNLFTCSQDTQTKMIEIIEEHKLNRIVVAACSPRTHEPLFQETMVDGGLNKYLFEMANIRNQDSWVHSEDPDGATAKAKDLVRMAVAKAALLAPLYETTINMTPSVLVVGGGVAGLNAALALSAQGFAVDVVEKSQQLGGQAN